MQNWLILQRIMLCVISVVYIVICNAVPLIKKVTLRDVIATAFCGSFSVSTNGY